MKKRALTLLFMITLAVAMTALDPPPSDAAEAFTVDVLSK